MYYVAYLLVFYHQHFKKETKTKNKREKTINYRKVKPYAAFSYPKIILSLKKTKHFLSLFKAVKQVWRWRQFSMKIVLIFIMGDECRLLKNPWFTLSWPVRPILGQQQFLIVTRLTRSGNLDAQMNPLRRKKWPKSTRFTPYGLSLPGLEDSISLVLGRVSELRSKITNSIHTSIDDDDVIKQVTENEDSLLNIRDALESLKTQLSSLQVSLFTCLLFHFTNCDASVFIIVCVFWVIL